MGHSATMLGIIYCAKDIYVSEIDIFATCMKSFKDICTRGRLYLQDD